MKYLALVLAVLAASLYLLKVSSEESSKGEVSRLLTQKEAIEIAQTQCKGKVNIPSDVTPVIQETDSSITVTFPTKLPAGTRGPDYHAKVTIDRTTRKIAVFMVGS